MCTALVGAHLISAVHNNDDSAVPQERMLTPSSLQIRLKGVTDMWKVEPFSMREVFIYTDLCACVKYVYLFRLLLVEYFGYSSLAKEMFNLSGSHLDKQRVNGINK